MPGGREETVSDKEILEIFSEAGDPFLFTGEVADVLGFSNQGALKRLKSLAESGHLNVKKSGKVPGWWMSDKGRAYLDASDPED